MVVSDVEVGDDTQDPLLLLALDLFDGGLYGRISHRYRSQRLCDFELAASQDYVLAWLDDNGRRGPVCETLALMVTL